MVLSIIADFGFIISVYPLVSGLGCGFHSQLIAQLLAGKQPGV
jgi:hypothetical protein